MDKSQFWKSISLSEELAISGRFIYNGLRGFHEMETLSHEDEMFEVLYNLSIGIERLLKIAVVLVEHDTSVGQVEFEKSLITHCHQELLRQLRKRHTLKLGPLHNSLLDLLGKFYKSHRYGRFAIDSAQTQGEEKIAFHKYLETYLDVQIQDDSLFAARNEARYQRFLATTVLAITSAVYEIIRTEALRLNVYTYEVRPSSKAAKIFTDSACDFSDEDRLWKELLVFFMNATETSGHFGILRSLEPLDFDPALAGDYLQSFSSHEKKIEVLSELESHYEDTPRLNERFKTLDAIGNPDLFFDGLEDDGQADIDK